MARSFRLRLAPRLLAVLCVSSGAAALVGPRAGWPWALAAGLLARAAICPIERLLNMLGHQYVCALAYALAFIMNGALCVALVPRFGGHGAAAATSISLVFETALLFAIVRRRLGLHVFAFGKIEP